MWLERFRRFWSQHLDALATEIARGKRERREDRRPTEPTRGTTNDRHRAPAHGHHREVDRRRERRRGRHVLLRRRYDAAVEDIWDAFTDPDRMKRWFLPVTGDLRVGGCFQLEGNAGGDILSASRRGY